MAAAAEMRVALVEKDEMGGTCLNRGCIPTKSLLHTAELMQAMNTICQNSEKESDIIDVQVDITVEGGRKTLDQFIGAGLWDEARILTAPVRWGAGTPSPIVQGDTLLDMTLAGDQVKILKH